MYEQMTLTGIPSATFSLASEDGHWRHDSPAGPMTANSGPDPVRASRSVSQANRGGADDPRHLWPHYFRLIRARWPAVAMGEQVAAAVGKDWLDGVFADLEGIDYACGAVVVPACAVNAPHRRDRLWFVAERSGTVDNGERARLERFAGDESDAQGRAQPDRSAAETGRGSYVADASSERCGQSDERQVQLARRAEVVGGSEAGVVADADSIVSGQRRETAMFGRRSENTEQARVGCWDNARWIIGHDGKARRVEPGIRLLVDGVSPWVAGRCASSETASRQIALKGFGNAIVPQVAAEVIAAWMEAT